MTHTSNPPQKPKSRTTPRKSRRGSLLAATVLTALAVSGVAGYGPGKVAAQSMPYPGANCVATIQNRSSLVDGTGSFVIPNVPANVGQYNVRVVCPQPDGSILGSTSAPYLLNPNGYTDLPAMLIGPLAVQPSSLKILPLSGGLTSIGSILQLQVQAIQPDGAPYDVTPASAGTTYASTNAAVATVSAAGAVTAQGPGMVYITASNNGLSATVLLNSFAFLDSDGDGMPDAYEIANGLNPYDPGDAGLDPDMDGLTNLQEYQLGTNPHVADTDGDGLNDGDEVKLGTNPLMADTDGDGLSDGDEVRLGTNPLLADTDGDGIPDGIEVKLGLNPLVADPVTFVMGHVTNPNGTPSVGTSVTIFTYFNAVTDATGTFGMFSIPADLGNISATAQAVVAGTVYTGNSTATAPVAAGTTDVGTIQLGQTAGQVSGYITTPDNKPAVGIQVTVMGGSDTRSTVTDSLGLYTVSGLSAGAVAVSAFDPVTSLRGTGAGTLTTTAPLSLNIRLAALGTITGTVRTVNGVAVGAGATVSLSGISSTTTDALGRYSFNFVSLGHYNLDATDSAGDHGRSNATITATAQTLSIDVQYLAQGTVGGVVSTATGTAVAGATVMLQNSGQISQFLTTTTNSLGQYSFTGILAGTLYLSATYAATNTGGSTTVNLTTQGQAVVANIMLMPTGTITGNVLKSDGVTAAAGAAILVQSTAFTATSDANGNFSIANVPLGYYQVSATDPNTGDRGLKATTLTVAGAAVPVTITYSGLGTVNVTVTDGTGVTPVAGVTVTANSSAPLNLGQTGVTASDGTVAFPGMLAGTISINAVNFTTGLSGTAQATLAPGGAVAVAVALQPAGTIQGTVFRADGVTPVAGVYITEQDVLNRQVITDSNGNYQLTLVPAGQHAVTVVDSLGNVLATNSNVNISSQGQVVRANFVLIGRGTVTGIVTNADGSVAPGIPVQVADVAFNSTQHPFGTQTDVNGRYTVPNVLLGAFTVVAQQHTTTTNSYGVSAGTMATDGQTVTVNVQLSSSLVPATLNLTDANNESYPIRETGGLVDGSYGVFQGDGSGNEGGSLLSLVQNGTVTPFTGQEFAPVDLSGRQISITQSGLDGLYVTRRVYVPVDGYFSRYLELLSNPTASDITVDVRLTSNYRNETRTTQTSNSAGPFQSQQIDPPHILLTSSGDSILNTADPQNPDHWLTLGGPQDDDPFLVYKNYGAPITYRNTLYTAYTTLPAIADVFDGAGAPLAPTSAGFLTDSSGTFSSFVQTYAAVRVPAGGTVGLLHFISQENAYAGANAAAARLAQLPPEALAGLSSADLGTVANFVIPNGGVSTLGPAPTVTNSVSGYVYAEDGVTVVPGAGISFQSVDPIFGRVYTTGGAGDGSFQFQGALGGPAIAAENYTLTATHPITRALSPPTSGNFTGDTTASTQSISFTNTATITGTVSRGPVVLNTAGTVTFTGGDFANPITIPINADGTFTLTGVPVNTAAGAAVGNYTLTAAVSNTLLTGTTTTTVTAGEIATADITIGDAGSVTGLVTRPDGSLAVNDTVYLRLASGNALTALVDTAGHYLFTDVPTGSYTVNAYDQISNSALTANILVTTNAVTTQNLALQSAGAVTGTVTVNDGSSTSGLTVTLTSTTTGSTQTLSTVTNTSGVYTINNVQPGSLVVRVITPANLQGTGYGSLPLAGQTATVNVQLLAAGNVTGIVYQADGRTPAAGLPVTISPAPLTGTASTTTDANGIYNFLNQPIGNFTVYVTNPATGDKGSANGTIQANGQLRTVNVTLIGFGNLIVKVTDGNGNIVKGANITVYDGNASASITGTSDATGTASFNQIAAGGVSVTARDPATGLSSVGNGTVAANGSVTVSLMLEAVGTIQGKVFGPDGVTTFPGATVQLNAPYGPSATTLADGSYTFNQQSVGGYFSFQARDSSGLVRAVAPGQILQTNGQVITQNLTLVPVGSVSGLVTYADGTRVENLPLSVSSQNTTVGGTQQVTIGGDGTYTVPEVPIGAFTVTVLGLPASETGYAKGTITGNGDAEVVNIQVVNSTVSLPATLIDADGFPYTILTSGVYASTYNTNITGPNGSTFEGAQSLSVSVNGGTAATFGNGSSPTTAIQTLSGQGVEISMPSLAGLVATRKIYVPTNGYFARRLDVLQNPTSVPVTVNVTQSGQERNSLQVPTVVNTSNGNTTIDKTILWEVSQDGKQGLPYPAVEPAIANVFAGAGAPIGMSNVTQALTSYSICQRNSYGNCNYVSDFQEIWSYAYNTITIPANGTVSLLFFTAQEATAGTGTSAAQRLVALPAEALAGLTSADLASVVNFVIPTAPAAAVNPPTPTTAISGHVYTGDGAIGIPNAVVLEQSTDLNFGSGQSVTADSTGAYVFSTLGGPNYAMQAMDPVTNAISPTVTGTYPSTPPATQDILFTNTGILQGSLQPTGQSTFASGSVTVSQQCSGSYNYYCNQFSTAVAADGSFRFLTVPAGTIGLAASVVTPQGGSYPIPTNGTFLTTVPAQQTTQFTFTLPATGNIVGKVTNADGTPAALVGVTAYPASTGIYASTTTDTNGNYSFASLLLDTYSVQTTDPITKNTQLKTATLTQDATATLNFQFIGKGNVNVTVKYANGNIAAGVYLYISTVTTPAFTYAAQSDANGLAQLTNVPQGAFIVQALYPGQYFYSNTPGTITADGQMPQLAVTLPPVGTISGNVTNADGTPASGEYVNAQDQNPATSGNSFSNYGATDSAGNYAIYPVPADHIVQVTSYYANNTTNRTIKAVVSNQQVPGDGKTLTVNLRYPGLSTVVATVMNADGSLVTSGSVTLKSKDGLQSYSGSIGANGTATFTQVVEATFVAYANTNYSNYPLGSTVFTVKPTDDNNTVNVTIKASPSGTVQGLVYASDGATLLDGGYNVSLLDIDTGVTNYFNSYDTTGFSFTGVQVGASGFTLTVTPSNNSSDKASVSGSITSQGQVVTDNITVPVSIVSGIVYLNDGVTPAPNVSVYGVVGAGETQSFYATTDANGFYQIAGFLAATVNLSAQDQNDVQGTSSVTLNSSTQIVTTANITLEATGTISGMIYDSNGQPLPDQDFYIQSSAHNSGFNRYETTDDTGAFTVTDIPIGNITVTSYIGGQNVSATGVLQQNGDSTTINIGAPPVVTYAGQAFGTVYDENQNPAAYVPVVLTPADTTVAPITVMTDGNGLYTAIGLPVGNVSVSATLADGTTAGPTVGFIADLITAVEIDVGLSNTGNVPGVVTDANGNPVANVNINAASTGDTSVSYGESTGDDGSFYFFGLAPGTVTLTVTDSQGNVLGTATGIMPYGGNLTLNVPLPNYTGALRPQGFPGLRLKPGPTVASAMARSGQNRFALASAGGMVWRGESPGTPAMAMSSPGIDRLSNLRPAGGTQ